MKEFSPIITIHGNKELYIENFKKIYELKNEAEQRLKKDQQFDLYKNVEMPVA